VRLRILVLPFTIYIATIVEISNSDDKGGRVPVKIGYTGKKLQTRINQLNKEGYGGYNRWSEAHSFTLPFDSEKSFLYEQFILKTLADRGICKGTGDTEISRHDSKYIRETRELFFANLEVIKHIVRRAHAWFSALDNAGQDEVFRAVRDICDAEEQRMDAAALARRRWSIEGQPSEEAYLIPRGDDDALYPGEPHCDDEGRVPRAPHHE
jgi:hypothetical protein